MAAGAAAGAAVDTAVDTVVETGVDEAAGVPAGMPKLNVIPPVDRSTLDLTVAGFASQPGLGVSQHTHAVLSAAFEM